VRPHLDLSPGGILWDSRGDTSGYALATVRGYAPPAELILDGEFGIPGALHGRLLIQIAPSGNRSASITFTNTAIGAIPPRGTAAHETGWNTLLQRLCAHATTM
jgi:hypothetical protein